MENRMARQICFVVAMLGVPSLSMAQEQVSAAEIGNPASIQAPKLTSAQLADLVAPIALYPDALLSQVLVASTYPLEVVQAQQWLRRNERLQGQELMDAARQQPWDASVQGLVAFPDALATLNEDIQWTTDLGNAFLAQESDVMVAVQRLRAQAQAAGRLSSNAAADGLRRRRGRADRHRDRAGRSAGDLRAAIRPVLRLGIPGVGRLSVALVRLWLRLRPGNQRRILVRRLVLGPGVGLGSELVRGVRLRQQRVLPALRLQLWSPRRLLRRAQRRPQRRPQRRARRRERRPEDMPAGRPGSTTGATARESPTRTVGVPVRIAAARRLHGPR